jgi:hypothetical protein
MTQSGHRHRIELFYEHAPRWRRRRTAFSWRNRESEPRVPAIRAVFSGEFLVTLEIEIALIIFAERDDEADLRPHANNARFKTTDTIPRSVVARELIVPVADEADLKLLGQEL